jgi:hypothetical protein
MVAEMLMSRFGEIRLCVLRIITNMIGEKQMNTLFKAYGGD